MKNCYNCNHCEVCRYIDDFKDKGVCDFYENGTPLPKGHRGRFQHKSNVLKMRCIALRENKEQEAIKILSDLAGYEKTIELIQNYSVSVQDSLHMAINALSAIEDIKQEIENYMISEGFGSGWIEDIKEIINKRTKGE